MKSSQKFLITGGAGFIGTNLAEYLVESGKDVVVVDDLSAGTDPKRLPEAVDFHKLDVRETDKLIELCQGVDTVVHLAAIASVPYSIEHPVETHDVNVKGTMCVLEAAKQAEVKKLVFASSAAVYGNNENLPHSVSMTASPETPYALHKYIGEQMMKMWSDLYGLSTVSLRFFNVYGSYLDPKGAYAAVIGKLLSQAKEGTSLTLTGDGEQTRDFVHVKDVCKLILNASSLDKVGSGEVFNVGTGKSVSINKLAEVIGGEVSYLPERNELRHSLAEIEETKKALDWEPDVSLEKGIGELKQEAGLET